MAQTGINDFSAYKERVDQYMSEVLTQYQTLKGTQGALQYVGALLEGPEEKPDEGQELDWLEKKSDEGQELDGLEKKPDVGREVDEPKEKPDAGRELSGSEKKPDAGRKLPGGEHSRDMVLENVTFSYEPGISVLKELSVTIPGGKVTAVIGNNGSGKSTLLKLLQGIYRPDSGRILLGGIPIDQIRQKQLRRQFGYILQNAPLFSGTIWDNIIYGVKGEVREEAVWQAARLADADEFIRALPQGYETDVGEAGSLLSGGQRQRIAIARTLMTAPECLLMDEAGASLDHKSDMGIYRRIRQSMEGKSVVVVAHDMRTVAEADHIIVLDQGRLEAAGSHEELLKNSPTYRSYLERQSHGLAGKGEGR